MKKIKGPNSIKKEIKEEVKRELGGVRFKGSPHEAHRMAEMLHARASGGIDIGYIKTLLFPELYNADVPQPLSSQSYTRFSDKKEFTVRVTSDKGMGMFLWYPKSTAGFQLFWRDSNTIDQGEELKLIKSAGKWQGSGKSSYSTYFSQANLVAASLQIQYVGQMQNEQGYFVGSQLYGMNPKDINVDAIENGQFRLMEKPGDGVRVVVMPKDQNDFTYYQLGATAAKNGGSRVPTVTADLEAKPGDDFSFPADTTIVPWAGTIQYALDADCVAIYYKGLAVGSDLRIDIIRKFNGFPLPVHRDVLDIQKPKKTFDPKRTIDVISELQDSVPQLAGHSIKAMTKVSDELQDFIPNLGHLYNEGMLKEGTTLRGFADQLQAVNGMEGSVVVTKMY